MIVCEHREEEPGAAKVLFVTFRLADSQPRERLDDCPRAPSPLKHRSPSPRCLPPRESAAGGRPHRTLLPRPVLRQLDEHLDAAHGSCALRDPRLAPILPDRLHHFDGQRYDLWSDVIIPNHIHALFTLRDGESLPDTLQGWKGVSSCLIHQTGLSALNFFWQPDYFDRLIRSLEHLETVKAYIRENTAKAGLKDCFALWERS